MLGTKRELRERFKTKLQFTERGSSIGDTLALLDGRRLDIYTWIGEDIVVLPDLSAGRGHSSGGTSTLALVISIGTLVFFLF